MRQEFAWPSSLRLELEARRLHAPSGEAALGEVAVGRAASDETAAPLALARFPVFFDLSACGLAAALVFPKLFFPGLPAGEAVPAGLAVALLPLALLPLGTALGRAVGRRYGRGVGLTGGQFVLGAATTAMAFLPGVVQAGWLALVLLVGCRLVQGLSAGAAWGDEPERAGRRMLAALSAALGFAVVGGLMAVLARVLSPADFADWGWRYPFAVGFVVNIVGLFANLRLLAIPASAPVSRAASPAAPPQPRRS